MKTAIYGAGSLGTVLGAYLAKAGVDVDLITRNREHVEALNRDGAKIIGTVNMTVPVHALTPDEMTEKYELIILLTKQLDNVNVLKKLQKNMTDDCIVCTLQNGLPELSVSEVVGEDRTMGCTVAWVQRSTERVFRAYERARQHELRSWQNERSEGRQTHAGEGAA